MHFGRTKTLLMATVLFTIASPSVRAANVVAKSKASVYVGPSGLKVTVVPLKKPSTKHALLFVQGADDNEMDDLVWLHKASTVDKTTNYSTKVRGKSWVTMSKSDVRGWWSTWKEINVHLYDRSRENLYLDLKASEEVDIDDIVKRYHKDKKATAKVAKFDMNRDRRETMEAIDKEIASAKDKCGFEVPVAVVWKTITPEVIKHYSVSSFCGRVHAAMGTLCEGDAKYRAQFKNKVKKVICQWSDKLAFKRSKDGVVLLSIDPNTGNQEDFVTAELLKLP